MVPPPPSQRTLLEPFSLSLPHSWTPPLLPPLRFPPFWTAAACRRFHPSTSPPNPPFPLRRLCALCLKLFSFASLPFCFLASSLFRFSIFASLPPCLRTSLPPLLIPHKLHPASPHPSARHFLYVRNPSAHKDCWRFLRCPGIRHRDLHLHPSPITIPAPETPPAAGHIDARHNLLQTLPSSRTPKNSPWLAPAIASKRPTHTP